MRYVGRRLWAGLMLVLLHGLLTASAAARELVVTLWDGITADDREGINAIITEFNQAYAGRIRVQRVLMPWGEFYQKLRVAVAGNAAPDLVILHRDRLPEQVLIGVLRPIDHLFQAFNFKDSDWLPGMADGGKYGGKRYGIPLDVHPLLLYYNQDYVAQAGLPGPPRTPTEFVEYAKKLTVRHAPEPAKTRWGARFVNWGPQFMTILWQMGGQLFGGPNGDQVLVAEDPGRRALEFVHAMVYELQVAPRPGLPDNMFEGHVAMNVDGIWWLRGAQRMRETSNLNLQVAPADRLFGEIPTVWAGSHMFAFPRTDAVDADKERATMTFVDFFGRRSVTWASYGQLPARRAAVDSPEFRQLKDHLIIAQQQFRWFPPYPWGTGGGRVEQYLLGPVIEGRASVAVALAQGKQQLEQYVAEMKKQFALP